MEMWNFDFGSMTRKVSHFVDSLFQPIFKNKIVVFWFKFPFNVLPIVQLIISQIASDDSLAQRWQQPSY